MCRSSPDIARWLSRCRLIASSDPQQQECQMSKAERTATVAPPRGTFTKSLQTQVDAGVGPLTRMFLERTRGDVARLRYLVARARHCETSVLDEVGRLAHSIHGTGAMFGYRSVSAAAGSIEACVK